MPNPADLLRLARKALRKPPHIVAHRLGQEFRKRVDPWLLPGQIQRFDRKALLRRLESTDLSALWEQLKSRPYVVRFDPAALEGMDALFPDERRRVLEAAELAMKREFSLLGHSYRPLQSPMDWHRDPKSGYVWKQDYFGKLRYGDPDSGADVKYPWELSRLQWALPLAQAYALTGDDRYADSARRLLESWMESNPPAGSINWTCTMEVALRIVTWTAFFHAFKDAPSWKDESFRGSFLTQLYLHARFTAQYLELSDVNGNHYTADVCGLLFAALFFGSGSEVSRWKALAERELEKEILRQVTSDGVDFEASTSYHRLVTELFLLPALYRSRQGENMSVEYRARLAGMSDFARAYMPSHGEAPVWGDADDARVLPLGGQALLDHRYLPILCDMALSRSTAAAAPVETWSEALWLYGAEAVDAHRRSSKQAPLPGAIHFSGGGVAVLRDDTHENHVFIDCGSVGLAGRGGHGHNDCLSFTASLAGVPLIVDSGCLVYTGSYELRNRFRSTQAHNTPMIDDTEINTIRWDHLWTLPNEARPLEIEVADSAAGLSFRGSHAGFDKLPSPVRPSRRIALSASEKVLEIEDRFAGEGSHKVDVPLHFHPDVVVQSRTATGWNLFCRGKLFRIEWNETADWRSDCRLCQIAPSYGQGLLSHKIVWSREGNLRPLKITIRSRGHGE